LAVALKNYGTGLAIFENHGGTVVNPADTWGKFACAAGLVAFMRIVEYIQPVIETNGASSPRWELYRVLSEPVRLRLLALAREEELTIGELAELLGESQPNVSRHVAPLKQAGLVAVRKQGTRALVRLHPEAEDDPVVCDALASGRAVCEGDGSLERVADVLRARDAVAREYFARPREGGGAEPPSEIAAFLRALAPLLPNRRLAIDAGTGDGALLDVLAPVFERVVAIDRSEAQLRRAQERVRARGYENVKLFGAEIDAPEVKRAAAPGAEAVFATRVLHHAPKPALAVKKLADLLSPGGTLVVLDYARHDDESMRDQADLWLGFEPAELRRFAREAALDDVHVEDVPSAWRGKGPDSHLPWQIMFARKGEPKTPKKGRNHHG
jgi:ArsR family transcriptional regulator